jgi:hypothetical protein
VNRERLAELADQLIPAEGGMPSASEAGAVGEWLDVVLAARPEFAGPLEALSTSAEPIATLPERQPAEWGVLTAAVVAAYYMNPDVCARVGYAGQRAIPLDPDAPPDYLQDGLLESVKGRGPVYRPTP